MNQQTTIEKYLRSGKPFKFYSDPGHGWLAVKREAVDYLGIKVSDYSYQKGNTVYLEEDLDASTFMKAYWDYLGVTQPTTYRFKEVNHNKLSPIRSYQRYTK